MVSCTGGGRVTLGLYNHYNSSSYIWVRLWRILVSKSACFLQPRYHGLSSSYPLSETGKTRFSSLGPGVREDKRPWERGCHSRPFWVKRVCGEERVRERNDPLTTRPVARVCPKREPARRLVLFLQCTGGSGDENWSRRLLRKIFLISLFFFSRAPCNSLKWCQIC